MTTAWLIERNDVQLCYSDGDTCFRWVTFTDPHAWRFDTQADAEKTIVEHKLKNVVAREHVWAATKECPQCQRTDPRAGATCGCLTCQQTLGIAPRKCDGCEQMRFTVDDTGRCRPCRRRDDNEASG